MTTATLPFSSIGPAVSPRQAAKAVPAVRNGGGTRTASTFPWMTAQMRRNLHPRAVRLLRADY